MRIFISALIFAVVVCNAFVFAEEPPVERWAARYNGPGNGGDGARSIVIDDWGNVYVTGYSYDSNTFSDYTTIKYDSNGNQIWIARYNGTGNSSDGTNAIALDNSGNVYVTGQSIGSGTDYDYATIKYDSNGNEKWVARYNGPGNGMDASWNIAIDNSGNLYVTGYSKNVGSEYDYATIKYDSNGNEKWVARYNYGFGDKGYESWDAMKIDGSGNVYITGRGIIRSGGNTDYITIKYDTNGNEKWVVFYDGGSDDGPNAITVDNWGNVYVTGQSSGGGGPDAYATIKYDSNGNQKWVARYSGPSTSGGSRAGDIALDNFGNVYVTGYSYGSGTDWDYATIKYDSNGNQKWVARYNGSYNGTDMAGSVYIDTSRNIYVTGRSMGSGTFYDYATVKYDTNGNEKWVARYDGTGHSADDPYAITLDGSGNVYVTGRSYGSGTGTDFATIKYTQHGVCLGEVEGDLNNDCKVDFADLAILASHWLECKYAYEGDCL